MSRAILTYHSIDDSGSPISIAPTVFSRHVAWLASGAVSVEPLAALLTGPTRTSDGRHRVALTFDDAFANFTTRAWPQLHAHGLPATVYVVTGHVGGTNRWGDRDAPGIPVLPLAAWDALARCADEGAEIGAHSHTHPSLASLSAAAVGDELDECLAHLATRLGCRPQSFAYPYGHRSDVAEREVAARFHVACTTEHRALGDADSTHHVPRLDMWYFQAPGALDAWGGRRWASRIAVRRAARAVRQRLARFGAVPPQRGTKGVS